MDVACWAFLVFVFLLNGAAFFVARYDKKVAEAGRRGRRSNPGAQRVPERGLLLLAALGAGPGLALAFQAYRHKTRKVRFLVPFWFASVVGVVLAGLWLWGLGCLPDLLG